MTELFKGSGVALVTPFNDRGIAVSVLQALVSFQLREGTDAIVVNGSTGEGATMSAAEQRVAAETVIEAAGGRVPVIVGVGGSDTAAVIQLAKNARSAGADALLVSPPPYNKPPPAGVIAHFRAILKAVELPLIIYNVPARTNCNILPETIAEIAEDERVIGVKEASGDIAQIADLARLLAGRVPIYSGNDDQTLPVLSLGGRGVISVLANIAPHVTSRMVHLYLEGGTEEARAIQLEYLPLIRALFRESNPIPVKAAVASLGFAVGGVRLPLVPLSPSAAEELFAAMKACRLTAGETVHA